VQLIAARLALTLEPSANGKLRARVMENAGDTVVASSVADSFNSVRSRFARWAPTDTVIDLDPATISRLPLDGPEERSRRRGCVRVTLRRRPIAWLLAIGDLDAAEREFRAVVTADPGLVMRSIVKSGQATFTTGDLDELVGSNVTDHWSEVVDFALREDRSIRVLTPDTEIDHQHNALAAQAGREAIPRALAVAGSIKYGSVSASLILRKLSAYPRQNGLALALRELGWIERTIFRLKWLQEPALRRRVSAALNKGEARNALTRAIFFHRLGEIRDRSFENQRNRASGLNLVTAAIVLWNTVYLERAIAALNRHQQIDDALIASVAPLGWNHINLTGAIIAGLKFPFFREVYPTQYQAA
jgi:hypothetical protein